MSLSNLDLSTTRNYASWVAQPISKYSSNNGGQKRKLTLKSSKIQNVICSM